ncbi:MAG: protein kinase domain-containing protein, partial [Planctomycetaceae bacterium]
LPWQQACRMTAQAAKGLSAAHAAGLIHRDIKPANLMIGRDGLVKVVDFGLSKAVHADAALRDGATQAGQILGTPHYMSPEQFEGAGVTPATDIYSLGATLYRLLTGRYPFESAGSIVALMKSHLMDPVPSIQPWAGDVPAECDRLIQRAMQKRAADRFGSAAEFADALELLLAGSSAVISGPVAGVLPQVTERILCRVLIAERSAMQGRMLAAGLKAAGAEVVELHSTVSAADARLPEVSPDVVWTAMELDDARGIDWLRRLSRRGSLADRVAVLHSSGLQPKDLQEFGGAACRVVAPKTAAAEVIVRVLSALGPVRSSAWAASSGVVGDLSRLSLRVFTDTGVLPENLKELLRSLQLMDVRVESLLRMSAVPETDGSLSLVLRTGEPTAGDSAMLAELLCGRQAEPVLILQSGAAGLLLRGAGWRGVLGVTERLVDSRVFETALRILSGAGK